MLTRQYSWVQDMRDSRDWKKALVFVLGFSSCDFDELCCEWILASAGISPSSEFSSWREKPLIFPINNQGNNEAIFTTISFWANRSLCSLCIGRFISSCCKLLGIFVICMSNRQKSQDLVPACQWVRIEVVMERHDLQIFLGCSSIYQVQTVMRYGRASKHFCIQRAKRAWCTGATGSLGRKGPTTGMYSLEWKALVGVNGFASIFSGRLMAFKTYSRSFWNR